MSSSFPSMFIPAPTDSYDHDNSTRANMTSLKALVAVFDASMDSLYTTIDEEMKRLDQIQIRIENHQNLETIKDDKDPDELTRIVCPCTFLENEHVHHEDTTVTALTNNRRSTTTPAGGGGGAAAAAAAKNKNTTTAAPVTQYYKPILYSHLSFLSKAKQAATDAILAVLKEEALTMQTTAKPSDVWLDRACAFEEAKDCRLALLKYRVPPLMTSGSSGISRTNHQNEHVSKGNTASKHSESRSRFKQETEYYKRGMNALMNEGSSIMRHTHTRKQEETGLLDDDGSAVTSMMNQSVASGRFTAYTIGNYSIYSQNTQGTASYRRRQRQIRAATSSLAMKVKEREEIDHDGGSDDDEQQQQQRRRREQPGHDDDNALVFKTSTTTTPYEPRQMGSTLYYGKEMSTSSKSRSSSRQHFMSGGLSYICEMVHDAYGLGSIHQQSNIYPKVENVCDLFYRGSDELAVVGL